MAQHPPHSLLSNVSQRLCHVPAYLTCLKAATLNLSNTVFSALSWTTVLINALSLELSNEIGQFTTVQ